MKRRLMEQLTRWAQGTRRKPLVLRGARQVGKSWMLRTFGDTHFGRTVELNFEREPLLARCFQSNDPRDIVRRVENATGRLLRPDGTNLLVLDEVQAAPQVLAKLRWFAEELPALPVAATGSLLDFALEAHAFSMPVGRVTYLHLEPMGFLEFLDAIGEELLVTRLNEVTVKHLARDFSGEGHERVNRLWREYLLVGGMPAAVDTWVRTRSFRDVAEVQRDLLASLRDDFAKYARQVHQHRLHAVMASVPQQLAQQFSYARVDRDERTPALKKAVELLCLARVCHRVRASPAQKPPLEAGASDKYFKLLLLDQGLVCASLGTTVDQVEGLLANEGPLAEQSIGQALRLLAPANENPALYFWRRSEPGSEAEVDYVLAHEGRLVPVEVKAGSPGTMKSLHALMAQRKWPMAVCFSPRPPELRAVDFHVPSRGRVKFQLLSLPPYLTEQLPRLLG